MSTTQAITVVEARKTIITALAICSVRVGAAQQQLHPELVAEVTRLTIWARWVAERVPITTAAVINAACRTLQPWQDDDLQLDLRAQAYGVLAELASLGDLSDMPGGRWLPTPLRRVRLSASDRWLLIGGAPTCHIPEALRQHIVQSGCARRIAYGDVTDALIASLPQQSEVEWSLRPDAPLDRWTADMFAAASLTNVTVDSSRIEVYLPRKSPTAPQYFRWHSLPRTLKGPHLIRTRTVYDGYHYNIAEVADGAVRAVGSLSAGCDVRRLCYGIDLQSSAPTTVRVSSWPDVTRITLHSELPQAEQRMFSALGQIQQGQPNAYYPRRWAMSGDDVRTALDALQKLGIDIKGVH